MRVFLALSIMLMFIGAARAQNDPLHSAADAYALYQSDVSVLLGEEALSPMTLDAALEHTARQDASKLTRGWIAYGAVSAAQSPAFVAGVQSRVRAAGRAAVLRQLRRDLTYARRRPPGSAEAMRIVSRAIAADSARLAAASSRVELAARDSDLAAHAPPSDDQRRARERNLRAADPRPLAPELAARIHLGALAADPLHDASALGGEGFWDALAGRTAPTTAPAPIRALPSPSLDRMVTLAALLAIDAIAGEPGRVRELLEDAPTRECLTLQQLQLRQCASVAHDSSEDAYCLARHGLGSVGACFTASVP